MAQKVTMIVGEPCVGKSLLMKELMKLDPWRYDSTIKYIPVHWGSGRSQGAAILGRYDDLTHKFPGTDRMSMAAQPHVIQFILRNPLVNFIFEGDRLGNYSMARQLDRVCDLEVIHLFTPDWVLDKRRAEFRQDQNARFVKSRHTKIKNLITDARAIGCVIRSVESTNLSDTHNLIAHLRKDRF